MLCNLKIKLRLALLALGLVAHEKQRWHWRPLKSFPLSYSPPEDLSKKGPWRPIRTIE